MEIKNVAYVKVWLLILNRLTTTGVNQPKTALCSYNRSNLISYYKDNLLPEYTEPNHFAGGDAVWKKTFKKGCMLEWFESTDISEKSTDITEYKGTELKPDLYYMWVQQSLTDNIKENFV